MIPPAVCRNPTLRRTHSSAGSYSHGIQAAHAESHADPA